MGGGARQHIQWFGHLRNTLKGLQLASVTVNPRVVVGLSLLEYLIVQYSTMLYVDDPDEGGDIPESDFHKHFQSFP